MTIFDRYVGCDVSKDWLDLFDPAEGRVRRIDNTAAAVERWAGHLARTHCLVVFEATGSYDRILRERLHRAGVASARLNPTLVRRYAQARGRKAKTDALDAAVLADLGERLRPEPDAPPCPHRLRLAELSARRAYWFPELLRVCGGRSSRHQLISLRWSLILVLRMMPEGLVQGDVASQAER